MAGKCPSPPERTTFFFSRDSDLCSSFVLKLLTPRNFYGISSRGESTSSVSEDMYNYHVSPLSICLIAPWMVGRLCRGGHDHRGPGALIGPKGRR